MFRRTEGVGWSGAHWEVAGQWSQESLKEDEVRAKVEGGGAGEKWLLTVKAELVTEGLRRGRRAAWCSVSVLGSGCTGL